MIELRDDALEFSFPDLHPHARCTIAFQRTLRIPDDNQPYPLPAGLGRFPLHHVDDHWPRLPPAWETHGGVFLPMYQAEALWIDFGWNYADGYPCAIKIATGKINAVSGELWANGLDPAPQDYLVITEQRWLDGYAVGQGYIRQFVAMPLGAGFSAEEQITGQATHGGLQIVVYPMKPERFTIVEAQRRAVEQDEMKFSYCPGIGLIGGDAEPVAEMALCPGGLMKQEIARDEYGIGAWDLSAGSRCFVHLVNSRTYQAITGQAPPQPPLTASDYAKAHMPWFEYYLESQQSLPGSATLAGLDSVGAKYLKKGMGLVPDNQPLKPERVINLNPNRKVREGEFCGHAGRVTARLVAGVRWR